MSRYTIEELAKDNGISLDEITKNEEIIDEMNGAFFDDSAEKEKLLIAAMIIACGEKLPVVEKYLRLLAHCPENDFDDFIDDNKIKIFTAMKHSGLFTGKLHNLLGLTIQDIIEHYVLFSIDYGKQPSNMKNSEDHEGIELSRITADSSGGWMTDYYELTVEPKKSILGGKLVLRYGIVEGAPSIAFRFEFDNNIEAPYDLLVHFHESHRPCTLYSYLCKHSKINKNIIRSFKDVKITNKYDGIVIEKIEGIRKF
jgi:hypothetical protein